MTEQQNPAQGGAQASTSIVPAGPAPEELAARAFLRMSVFNARALMSQDFPPVKELVPGIMPCGLSLLVSAPKIGKSWLALGLAYELATGGKALGGIPVSPRPVLYLALEDGCRRLQSRLRHMGIKEIPRDLWFRVRFERDLGPLESMNAFFSKFKDQGPLVILDTLGKVLPYFTPQGRESVFEHDYRVMSAFKNLVDGYDGATLLIIHHVRKDKTSDFLENVSGTNAIAGAADTIMLLSRKRGESEGTLEVTSRDTEEGSYALHFDNDHGLWSLQGDSLEEAKQTARQSLLTVNKGELMTGIIKYVTAQHKPVSAKEVVDAFPGFKEKTVREYLNRAQEAEAIRKLGRGQYASLDYTGVETVETVENGEKPIWDWSTPANSTDSTNSTQSGNRRQTTKSYWGPFPTEKVSGGGYS